MVSDIVVQYTRLLRTSDIDLWVRSRELLRERGLDPAETVVVDLLQESLHHEEGQIISAEGRVHRFHLYYDQQAEDGAAHARIGKWTDATDDWHDDSLTRRTADAFAWKAEQERQARED
ncbi:hypothetical protein ACFY00_31055 [Kitasatospora sp. NPDC001540]|uniref:hypothetical protein n=1 Tax=Kitasatospora sp. NPDC001540 TaxID=3364014 RepID=UPI0036B8E379